MAQKKKVEGRSQSNMLEGVTPEELRTIALNAEGTFFQENVRKVFEKSGFKLHAIEYGVSAGSAETKYRESRLDLWFRCQLEGCVFNILVECKKADPKLKEWIFFRSPDDHPNLFVVDCARRNQAGKWQLQRFNTAYSNFYAFSGKELKGEWTKNGSDSWKTATARIDDACDQVAIALRSISMQYEKMTDLIPTFGGMPHFLIPVVVTNANLLTCELSAESIDRSEVNVSEVLFDKRENLIIRHPMAPHMQMRLWSSSEELSKNFVFIGGYLDTFISHFLNAPAAVQALCKEIAREYKPMLKQ